LGFKATSNTRFSTNHSNSMAFFHEIQLAITSS
jgi:hypothetical protein